MGKEVTTAFSDAEWERLKQIAAERGVPVEEVVSALASEGLANRVRKKTGRRPAASILKFRRSHQ